VIPIYFWKGREGNRHSLAIHNSRFVRLLALFGRRPKVGIDGSVLGGKINHELLVFAKRAHEMGIPSIAGFCLSPTLFELTEDPAMYWIPLWEVHKIYGFADILFQPSPDDGGQNLIDMSGQCLPAVPTEDIAFVVQAASSVMSFATAVEVMSELRSPLQSEESSFPWWGSGYKPVYFLISAD
jgi:hypothetical protein